jgi:hypothetical protein
MPVLPKEKEEKKSATYPELGLGYCSLLLME